ncbi:glycosyltransferase [Candidatus Saccharibacteria bacterium]|nr:glycosyltransferase [Candidatus Saccharibacteria bacterium]
MEKGGAERVITTLANVFSVDNDVVVLSLTRSKDAYKLNSSVKRLHVDSTSYKNDGYTKKILRRLSLRRLVGFCHIIKVEKPDVIISFLPEPSIRLMFIKRFSYKVRNIPTIISIRSDPEKEYHNRFLKFIVKRLYRNVDGMVYQTEDAKKYFKGFISTKKQVIIQNPVDKNILMKPKDDEERRNVIVSVGRLEKNKNQELLIRAFGDVIENGGCDYILEIFGEGSLRAHLQDLIKELGLDNKVFLKGQIDNVIQEINNARIFVLSSLYEGMPNALMEAMAMGLPCISTDCPCGGPRALIRDGENGILTENDNEEALKGAINRLVDNVNMRKRIAKKALEIRETNSISLISKSWMEIINDALEKEGRGGCRASA